MAKWTNEEVDFLKENFQTMLHKELAEVLGRTEQSVRAKCFKLNLYKKEYSWSEKELEFLKENYKNMTYREIGKILGRTLDAVKTRAEKMGLRKDFHYCDFDYFKIIDTEEKAYWLGFIFADGWVYTSEKHRSWCTGIELQKDDIGHLRKFNKSINGNYSVDTRVRTDSFKDGDPRTHKTCQSKSFYETCFIRIFSKQFTDNLIDKGVIQNKSLVKKFPNYLPEDLVRHFIRGYFDGNGSVWSKTQNTLCFKIGSGSKDFITVLRDVLIKSEIYCSEILSTSNKHGKDTYFTFDIYSNFENSLKFYNYLYLNSTIYLERKFQKATSLKDKIETKRNLK